MLLQVLRADCHRSLWEPTALRQHQTLHQHEPPHQCCPWKSRRKTQGTYHRGGPRLANTSPTQALLQPGIICRKRFLLLHGKSSPLQMLSQAETQPRCIQELGEMTGEGPGQAELLVTPADTNQRGIVGSVAHRSAKDSPENGTTLQEGPPDPTRQYLMLQPCPSVQDPAQQHLVHKCGST